MKFKRIFGNETIDLSEIDTKLVDTSIINVLQEYLSIITYQNNKKDYSIFLDGIFPTAFIKKPNEVKEIQIGRGIKNFERGAFYGCTNLNKVVFNCNIFDITTDGDFADCSNLKNIVLNSRDITHIPKGEFDDSQFTSITLPPYYETIDWGAFKGCIFEEVIIPEGVTNIGSNTFTGCNNLKSVIIPSSIEKSSSIHPKTLQTENGYAFRSCQNLTEVHLTEGLQKILTGMFSGCKSLTSITIPDSVTSIGSMAFYNTNLSKVEIPLSVNTIQTEAFELCRNLTSVSLPSSIKTIGELAFCACPNLSEMIFNGSMEQWNNIIYKDGVKTNIFGGGVVINGETIKTPLTEIICNDGIVER